MPPFSAVGVLTPRDNMQTGFTPTGTVPTR